MRVTVMLSMVVLAGTFYVSAASAQSDPVCTKQFNACKSEARMKQHEVELGCRQKKAADRMVCKVTYSTEKRSCSNCGVDRLKCLEEKRVKRNVCTSGHETEQTKCLSTARKAGDDAVKQCEQDRAQCPPNPCP